MNVQPRNFEVLADLVDQAAQVQPRADAADRAGQHVIEHERGDGELRQSAAHGFVDDLVDAAAHEHAAALDVDGAYRVGEQHDRQDEPWRGLADGRLGDAADVIGGGCEIAQYDGRRSPERDERQHHGSRDYDVDNTGPLLGGHCKKGARLAVGNHILTFISMGVKRSAAPILVVVTSEELARSIVLGLRSAGHQAYLVGGCVRDLLLGCPPKDFDIATDARPDRVSELFERTEQVGAHFGVVLVREGASQVEVATFRSDSSYSDGRRPDRVRFEAGPREDALRRDFTINALLLDPETGEVLDFTGGREDLRRRTIRAIGDPEQRFEEDHLRLLRAVRFAARLGFEIEPATMAALQRLHGLIVKVSAERIRDELARILTEGGARRGFELLDETGLLGDILPEVAAMKGVEQPPQFHPEGDVWTHTLLLLEKLRNPTVTLAMGALLHDVGKPPTFRVAERIRFDGHAAEGVRMAHEILT